jgi:hypothetical protein
MTSFSTVPSTTFTARTPEDVLAMVPVVLGFVPTESVAMLTFGARQPFHARVDLPVDVDEIPEVVASLRDPARGHGVRRALFVLYTADARLGAATARALAGAFERCGIDVIDALRADGERWFPAVGTRPGVPPWGVPYDVSAHPFLARAVVDGRVTYPSREDLRATLAGDRSGIARVVGALAALAGDPGTGPDEAVWARSLVERHVRAGTSPEDHEVARLLRGMLETGVRDAAWAAITRESAREHVRFWSDVLRRGPTPMLAPPAALLAFAAWQAGQGALAWCALDRCAEADEHYSLATLVAEALQRAVPPDAWEQG